MVNDMTGQDSDAGVALNRNTRASCWGGELGCAANCMRRGRFNGGCCGESYTRCHGTCYCNGSGYEHRCYDCDLK